MGAGRPEDRLLAQIETGEQVLAAGRAEVRASNERKRAYVRGWFVLVTDRRVLWIESEPDALRFEAVSGATTQWIAIG